MNNKNYFVLTSFVFVLLLSCREKFDPPEVKSPPPVLIVEGLLTPGTERTSIRLTRSVKLDTTGIVYEQGARVTVEGANFSRVLPSTGNGIYSATGLNLIIGQDYRLRIITSAGREYVSKMVTMKRTPPIDSIGFKQEANGIRLYVNTQDPSGASRYYKWDFDDTWEINSYYQSNVIFQAPDSVRLRRMPQEDVFRCWKYGASTGILVGSSEKLTDDVLFQAPIAFIPNGDERLSVRYSINVKQYVLDQAGFEFYELMKKNTESLGTIFDAQPTEITGNITCVTDPTEIVIGYISAATLSVRRFFITKTQTNARFDQYCPTTNVLANKDSIREAYSNGGLMPYVRDLVDGKACYLSSSPDCVDCRERGGSLSRPSYW